MPSQAALACCACHEPPRTVVCSTPRVPTLPALTATHLSCSGYCHSSLVNKHTSTQQICIFLSRSHKLELYFINTGKTLYMIFAKLSSKNTLGNNIVICIFGMISLYKVV